MKMVSHKMLVNRINRTGDGTHPFHAQENIGKTIDEKPAPAYWGWGDKRLKKEDVEITQTLFPAKNRRG